MERRILIGSCGGLTGSYLARQFREIGCTVIGADSNEHNAARPFLDEFAALPGANAPDFCDRLLETLEGCRVDYYLPTHSKEIRAVAQQEDRIRERWGGGFLVSPWETFARLDNKRTANRCLQAAGIPVPRRVEEIGGAVGYPVFMKPDLGSGSSRAQVVETENLHREYARLYPDAGFYEYIKGTEYTVDCVFDAAGRMVAYNQRIRVKSMGGGVIISQNDYGFDILPYLRKLEGAFLIKGCVNFQYILRGGVPYFTDINLRYASGGLPLTVASGIDVPRILLALWENEPLPETASCGAAHKTMYRYFQEWYETV
ncbi:MAG: ATP-grasp domain-containing protein [Oscillospiraceae bacterium]|nr:ATP-grasp domain-containing protein [Oscillospiraceae bacterium]